MATEEDNSGEFQEKTGLKRKLTGPPRLLLGKPKSPGQEEKSDAQALRKQRRDKNNQTPMGTAEENQNNSKTDCESQKVTCQCPQTVSTIEEETHSDIQNESLSSLSKLEPRKVKRQHGKDTMGRSRAKATIRRVFSPAFTCVRRRKKLDVKSAEDAEDSTHPTANISLQDILTNDKNKHKPQPISDEPLGTSERNESEPLKKEGGKKRKRKFGDRMWPIFKRLSVTRNCHQRQERGCEKKINSVDTFIEIASENSVHLKKSPSGFAVETTNCRELDPSGNDREDDQLKGSSEIDEEMTRINQEKHLEIDLDHKEDCIEKFILNAEVSLNLLSVHEKPEQMHCAKQDSHKHQIPELKDKEDIKIQMKKASQPSDLLQLESASTCIKEHHSATEEPERASERATANTLSLHDLCNCVPVEQCKPIITIENVHSSDEENQESFEYGPPQCNLLSTVFSMNGSCHPFKVNNMKKCTLQTWNGGEHNSQFSEILLVQTAFSLVNTAISAAVEQLTAELQRNQADQDHV